MTQRKMYSKNFGWVRCPLAIVTVTMRRMKYRVDQILSQHRVLDWSERIRVMKRKMLERIHCLPYDQWEVQSFK